MDIVRKCRIARSDAQGKPVANLYLPAFFVYPMTHTSLQRNVPGTLSMPYSPRPDVFSQQRKIYERNRRAWIRTTAYEVPIFLRGRLDGASTALARVA